MGKKENESSTNDAVCTPASIFEPVLKALGIERFDLDPCSHPNAIVPVKRAILMARYGRPSFKETAAGRVYEALAGPLPPGAEERIYGDGLLNDWSGQHVWKNSPYSQLQHTVPTKKHPNGKYPWFHKLAYEAARGVAFVPSRTSSRWWHHWVLNCERADILVQLKGRVKHHGEKWGSPFHQVLVGYGLVNYEARRGPRLQPEVVAASAVLDAWREAFDHPDGGFVTDLREMRR